MHSVLRNAISTMNYLLLLQATKSEHFPECVVDELGQYIDGLNDLLVRDDQALQELKEEIKSLIKEELSEGVYLDQRSPQDLKNCILCFYEENYIAQFPSALWYSELIDEVVAEKGKEAQLDL